MAADDNGSRPSPVDLLTPITEEDQVSVRSPSAISLEADEDMMDDNPIQQRLYIISRSGSGEAQYVLLNKERTEFASYSVRLETWRILKNIAYFGVAVVDNVLYVIGGYDKINCRHLHRVLKYDPFETTWSECAPLLKARAKFGCCVLDGKIHVSGGERSDGHSACSCEVYDPLTDIWSDAGRLVAPRSNHCCTVYQQDIYCAGGDFGTQSHDNFWVYEKNNWEELDADYPTSMPRCIDRAAMCTVGNKIYIIGGVSCRLQGNNGAHRFITERGIFSYNPSVSALSRQRSHSSIHSIHSDMVSPWTTRYPSMVRPRHSPGVYVLGTKIYVFGGSHLETGQDARIVECFDTERGKWEDDFRFRKGDVSNLVCAALEVPRKHDEEKVKFHLKWVLW